MPLMYIPREFIQRLRDAIPVSEVVGKRVPLKRKGREWEACCPFHQEKSPSFYVNDAKGFYHCFGCSAHGDGIKFLMEYEKMSYTEAVHTLAREVGMDVPQPTPDQERRERQRQSLEEIIEKATQWFCQQLPLAGGAEARDYLLRRGVTLQMQQHFRLGYAPDSRHGLRDFLLAQGASEAQLVAAGLVIQGSNFRAEFPTEQARGGEAVGVAGGGSPLQRNTSYDRFRGRLMFPITDAQGQVIAFGGRVLAKDVKAAKYLNSPETELFHKGQLLYHWREARAEVTERTPLLVVEGYMDVIALTQAGFPQAVAPLGTALTESHLEKLWKACDAPIICLDGDTAGQRAMRRTAELALPLLQPGKSLQFCVLPGGQDPDDYLRQHGAEGFRKVLAAAQPLSQVMVATLRAETGFDTPEQRAGLEAKLEALAARIKNTSLQQHFRRYFRQQLWPGKKAAPRPTAAQVMHLNPQQGVQLLERQVLRLLLCYPVILQDSSAEEALGRMHFHAAESLALQGWLLQHVMELSEESLWPPEALGLRDDASVSLPPAASHVPHQAWAQLMDGITLVQMQEDLKEVERRYGEELAEELLTQMQALKHQIQELQNKRFGG